MKQAEFASHAKAIIFGEHSIVYKGWALAVPVLNLSLTAEISSRTDDEITFSEYGHSWLLEDIPDKYAGIRFLLSSYKERGAKGFDLKIESTIPESRGMGSSAASAHAVASVLAKVFGPDEKEDLTTEAEDMIHHKSSGLDLTAVQATAPIAFNHDKSKEALNRLGAFLLIADTGKDKLTGRSVSRVQNEMKKDKEISEALNQLSLIAYEGIQAWRAKDVKKVGELMNSAQSNLRILGVSCTELENVISILNDKGALGSKLSGAGNGGIAIGLFESEEASDPARKALAEKGFRTYSAAL